jgi:hypothetical protein
MPQIVAAVEAKYGKKNWAALGVRQTSRYPALF